MIESENFRLFLFVMFCFYIKFENDSSQSQLKREKGEIGNP